MKQSSIKANSYLMAFKWDNIWGQYQKS